MKNQAITKANDTVKKMEAMKKAHEVEIRNLRKQNRKLALEFFKQKSEHCVDIFKQEQMYMVEEYYTLKKKEYQKEKQMVKL